ncbi:hypothetical protein BH23PSE1_BH23PSE1_18900 [soil metagenome]
MTEAPDGRAAGGRAPERAMLAGLIALALTGGLYLAGVAAFAAMLWTLFQVILFLFGAYR